MAGPVVAAAVILPQNIVIEGLNDSKKLSAKARAALEPEIKAKALAWAVGECSPEEIDKFNILKCSFMAMHRALDQLKLRPELILVDGNRFVPYQAIPYECMIKGDARFMSIAAASVLAKTHRDRVMEHLHHSFGHYQWHRNMGYPTAEHRTAIRLHGVTPHHRLSFTLLQPELPFASASEPE